MGADKAFHFRCNEDARHTLEIKAEGILLENGTSFHIGKSVLQGYYDDSAEKVLKPIRRFFAQQGITAQFVSKVGPADQVIVNATKKGKYDLMILGSHGHGTLSNLVMGSVATKVLADCDTPALLVR